METSQRQIIEGTRSSLGKGDNVIHGKRYVLPLLCGVAILAQAVRSAADMGLDRLRNLAAGRQWIQILFALRLGEITDKTIEQTEVIIDFLICI